MFAAASLTEAFADVGTALGAGDPGLSVRYSFAGSGALVAQVQQGAPADVVATADTASMARLVDAGLVTTPTTFARNQLQILVAPGNPLAIASLADLARPDLKVVLGAETVPAGRYAAQALQAAGITVAPVSYEADVKAAVAKVTLGEADATIVYVTDVIAAGAKGQGVAIPDAPEHRRRVPDRGGQGHGEPRRGGGVRRRRGERRRPGSAPPAGLPSRHRRLISHAALANASFIRWFSSQARGSMVATCLRTRSDRRLTCSG